MNFDEFKKEVLQMISHLDEIPNGALMIINKAFSNMEEIYNSYNCMNSSIQEYFMECMEQAKMNLKANIGNERKNNYFEQLTYILNKLELNGLEITKEDNVEDKENGYYKDFMQVGCDNNRFVNIFNIILQEQMENVNIRQGRILSSRGYSDEKNINLQNEVRTYINRFIQNIGEEVLDLFKTDDKKLQEWLISKYDEYIKANSKEDKKEELKKEIDAGISLEEQHERAISFQEEKKPLDLPDNVLE